MAQDKSPADADRKPKTAQKPASPPKDDPRDDLHGRVAGLRAAFLSLHAHRAAELMRKDKRRH